MHPESQQTMTSKVLGPYHWHDMHEWSSRLLASAWPNPDEQRHLRSWISRWEGGVCVFWSAFHINENTFFKRKGENYQSNSRATLLHLTAVASPIAHWARHSHRRDRSSFFVAFCWWWCLFLVCIWSLIIAIQHLLNSCYMSSGFSVFKSCPMEKEGNFLSLKSFLMNLEFFFTMHVIAFPL